MGVAVRGGDPEWATHFDAPDHGTPHLTLCIFHYDMAFVNRHAHGVTEMPRKNLHTGLCAAREVPFPKAGLQPASHIFLNKASQGPQSEGSFAA